jgi:RNA polymerase sigma-70 factor (ECF subfamily)
VKPYERTIYIAAMGILQNEQQAEDASQETLLKAFVHLKRFRGEAKFSTCLIQVAINEARMRLRKEHRALYDHIDDLREDADGDYRPVDFADWRPIPSEALANRELREAIERGIAGLSPRLREVFVMRDVQQFNIAETANILRITQQSVRTRLLRARLAMRDALAPFARTEGKAKAARR